MDAGTYMPQATLSGKLEVFVAGTRQATTTTIYRAAAANSVCARLGGARGRFESTGGSANGRVASLGRVGVPWLPRRRRSVKAKASGRRITLLPTTAPQTTHANAKLEWDWRLADRGRPARRKLQPRALANFANNHFFAKDLLQTSGYVGDIDWQLGAHLFLNAKARRSSTTHSAVARAYQDYVANSGGTGIRYVTEHRNEVRMGVTVMRADILTMQQLGIPFDQKVQYKYFGIAREYMLTGKTHFGGSAGYLKRDTLYRTSATLSGSVWHTRLLGGPEPRPRSCFSAGRQLTAYLDSQCDYFVSNAVSVAPTGHPARSLSFAPCSIHTIVTGIFLAPIRCGAGAGRAPRDRVFREIHCQPGSRSELIRVTRRTCLSVADRQ